MSFTPLTQLDVTHLFRVTGTRKNRAVDSGPAGIRIYTWIDEAQFEGERLRGRVEPGPRGFNAAFPGWTWEVSSFVVPGNTVIVEARESGVWTRPWEIFGFSLEPSGEAYDDQDAVFFEVRDGLICQNRVYITNNCARIYQIDKRIAEMASAGSE